MTQELKKQLDALDSYERDWVLSQPENWWALDEYNQLKKYNL